MAQGVLRLGPEGGLGIVEVIWRGADRQAASAEVRLEISRSGRCPSGPRGERRARSALERDGIAARGSAAISRNARTRALSKAGPEGAFPGHVHGASLSSSSSSPASAKKKSPTRRSRAFRVGMVEHTRGIATVASFRTWRGSRPPVARPQGQCAGAPNCGAAKRRAPLAGPLSSAKAFFGAPVARLACARDLDLGDGALKAACGALRGGPKARA